MPVPEMVWGGDISEAYYRRTHNFLRDAPLEYSALPKAVPTKGDISSFRTKYWTPDIPPYGISYSRRNISQPKMLTGQNFLQ